MNSFDKAIRDLVAASESAVEKAKPSVQKCAYCALAIETPSKQFSPFCSLRCQQLDLSNWLGERYGLPWEDEEEQFEAE